MPGYQIYTDAELFLLVKEGDNTAFSEIYDRYWELLFRHAKRMTRDDGVAQDIVQDVFISLWDKIEETDMKFSLSSYLYTSVRNKILNLIEHNKVRNNYLQSMTLFIPQGENLTDHRVRDRMLKEKIEQEVLLLPVKMKQVFEMSRKQNMSYKEIAETLNLSDKTVKKQINNALKILRFKLTSLLLLLFCTLILHPFSLISAA